MKQQQNFIIKTDDEETARKRAMQWYADKKNLTIDSVEPSPLGGFFVSISYDFDKNSSTW